MRLSLLTALALTALSLTGCEEKKSKINLSGEKIDCALTLDTLAGTDWVLEQINPDKTVTPNPGTRLRIYKEGDKFQAKYNVGSFADMYTYNCDVKNDELVCKEPAKLVDFCKALSVADGSTCTVEKLKEFAPEATDEELAKAVETALADVAKYKDKPEWKQFVGQNNNLGNKLQGLLWAKVDTKTCKLRITDMYMTIYNGKRVEDSNPVGTNPFVQTKEELLWEHCADSGDLFVRKSKDHPAKPEDIAACFPNQGCTFGATEEAFYHYLGQDGRDAKDGCTYSYDLWLNGKPFKKDIPAEVVDVSGKKEVRWSTGVTFPAPGQQVMVMVRNQSCAGGAKEKIEVSCNMAVVK